MSDGGFEIPILKLGYSLRDKKLHRTEADLSYILRYSVSAKHAKEARAITQSMIDVQSRNFQDILKMVT